MTISLIIPTYNRFDCLSNTLESLIKCSVLPNEVIISDQNEPELFGRIEKEIAKCKAKVSEVPIVWKHVYCKKIGSSVSRNKGLNAATGDILVFTDDDVLYPEHFFKNVLSVMTDERIAMIGGVNYKFFPSKRINLLKRMVLTMAGLNGTVRNKGSVSFGVFGNYPSSFDKAIPTEWAMGYCMVFRKEPFRKSGLHFDEKLTKYAYGEDLELTYLFYRWCRKNGFRCILTPDVGVYHMASNENRLNRELSYLKVFVNRKYINNVFHGNSVLHKALLAYSNWCYILLNAKAGFKKEVCCAYKLYKKRDSNCSL